MLKFLNILIICGLLLAGCGKTVQVKQSKVSPVKPIPAEQLVISQPIRTNANAPILTNRAFLTPTPTKGASPLPKPVKTEIQTQQVEFVAATTNVTNSTPAPTINKKTNKTGLLIYYTFVLAIVAGWFFYARKKVLAYAKILSRRSEKE